MKLFTTRAFRHRIHPFSWKRRWRILVLDWLGREEPAERVAAAIALGVGVGFSPFLGAHFVLALGLAYLFRLNRLDAVLGQFVGNPWTIPPVYAIGFRLGRWLLRYDHHRVPRLPWEQLGHEDFWVAFRGVSLGPRLLSFLVGTTALAVAIGFATYFLTRAVLALFHRRHPRVAERAARRREALVRRRHIGATRAGGA
ncbi:MAG TPA: DUF2062 domain-containing protein [Thermoanaerobaculia bacterium]|nr:DUF2062 domain-containing protein [Thermoanaerobaculia bacterium]